MTLASMFYFSSLSPRSLSPSHTPIDFNLKEGRRHQHLLNRSGVGSSYAAML
ncbi:MAG: hypothetical protein AAF282_09440 [Cyanobacteria bacterium P01_A01_bin.15]